MLTKLIDIDWLWVKDELKKRERIRYDSGNESGESISESLDRSLDRAKILSKPEYIYEVKKVSAYGQDFIELEGGTKFSSAKIPAYIKGASHIVIFLVTIGDAVENEAGSLTKDKEPLEGYLLDRVGSFAVESVAISLEGNLRKHYSRLDKSISRRYSPGYCDWPIEEQRILANILDFSKIGVSLNESCMMKPKKSISAIVAIANKGVFTETGSTCEICEKKDCSYRRDN